MGRLIFSDHAWEDYEYWLINDKGTIKRINRLIEDARRHPYGGIGKPEPLKYALQGAWSRRITEEHRMAYLIAGEDLAIVSLRYHY